MTEPLEVVELGKSTSRQARKGRKNARADTKNGLNIAVVTAPDGVSMKRDISLVRASILYADEIELISLGATVLDVLTRLGSPDPKHLWRFLESLDDDVFQGFTRGSFPAEWHKLLPYLTGQRSDPRVAHLNDLAVEVVETVRTQVEEIRHESEIEELAPALKAGIVRISPAASDSSVANIIAGQNVMGRNDAEIAAFMTKWVEFVRWLLEDSKKRLLFDGVTGEIARSLIDQGEVKVGSLALKHAGEAALGSGLIARLPAFPQAPLDELLDLRSDLKSPLTRYRTAISSMAARLTVKGLGADAAAEIDDMWVTDVNPALVDIEEGLAQHGLIREIGRSVGQDVKTLVPGGAAIYVGFENLTTLGSWVSATAAVAAPAAQALITGAHSALTGKRNVRRKEMYYLYEVNRRLQ